MTDHCTSCGAHWSEHVGISGTCAQLQEANDLLADAFAQMAIDVGSHDEAWHSDGCESTCEELADYLHKIGRLEKHKTKRLWRFRKLDTRPGNADSVSADMTREA